MKIIQLKFSVAGKSYTMLGRPDSSSTLGAIPCAISWLFRGIAEQKHKCGTRFSVRVSAVELCTNTNQIRDLLAPYHNGEQIYCYRYFFPRYLTIYYTFLTV